MNLRTLRKVGGKRQLGVFSFAFQIGPGGQMNTNVSARLWAARKDLQPHKEGKELLDVF